MVTWDTLLDNLGYDRPSKMSVKVEYFFLLMYHFILHFVFPPRGRPIYLLNPLPDDKILDLSKLKQIKDDILKCI